MNVSWPSFRQSDGDVQARDRAGWRLDHDDFLGPWSLQCVLDCELNCVAIAYPLSIRILAESAEMHKGICQSICPTDEAVPFLMAKPLDMALLSIAHWFLAAVIRHCAESPP
jgi:hypothetical protein